MDRKEEIKKAKADIELATEILLWDLELTEFIDFMCEFMLKFHRPVLELILDQVNEKIERKKKK